MSVVNLIKKKGVNPQTKQVIYPDDLPNWSATAEADENENENEN